MAYTNPPLPDDNEPVGLTEFTQFGVEMPDGKVRWSDRIGEPRVAIPGGPLLAVEGHPRYAHNIGLGLKSFTYGVELWESRVRSTGITLDQDVPRPVVVTRTVYAIVTPHKYWSSPVQPTPNGM